MNRTTRLSLIAVMLLATSALGILGWNAMHPPQPASAPPSHPPPQPIEIFEDKPRPNPEYEKLQADLKEHERRCLLLVKQATIVLPSQNQNNQSPAEQRVKECRNLVEIEREYVKNFPAKTIQ
jgi:hypothetical protein